MQPLEKMLDDAFKNLPPMPEVARKNLVKFVPWLALAGGVLSLLSAWYLYQVVSWADRWTVGYANTLYHAVGYSAPVSGISVIAWIGLLLLLAQGVLFLMAFQPLRSVKKNGWDLLLWTALASVVYAIVINLFGGYINMGQLLFSLIANAIGLYLLFQIRSHYTAKATKKPTKKS